METNRRGTVQRPRYLLLVVALSVRLASPIFGQESSRMAGSPVEELKAAIQKILDETGVPGAGIALVSLDGPSWSGGLGMADRDKGQQADEDTLFRIGSISKTFVALAVMQLQETGRLKLSDNLRDLAPEVAFSNPWEEDHPVKLVHLLEHTAGFDEIHFREFAHDKASPIDLRAALDFNPGSRVSRWPPGTHFSYSNSGPAIAAYIVEKVSGKSFEDYAEEFLFDPLEMKTASYFSSDTIAGNRARGYQGPRTVPYRHILMRPSGALNVSVGEMANLIRMLLQRGTFQGKRIVSPDSVLRMETPTTTVSAQRGLRAGYGLGLLTSGHKGFLFWGHGGRVDGFTADFGYLHKHGSGYAVMLNSPHDEALRRIVATLRDHLIRDLEKPPPLTSEIPVHRFASLSGYYRLLTPRWEVNRFLTNFTGIVYLEQEGVQLTIDGSEDRYLLPVSDRLFRGPEDPIPTAMFFNQGEKLVLQSFSLVLRGNFEAVPGVRIWLERLAAVLVLGLISSCLLASLYWIPALFWGRLQERAPTLRLIPLLTSLSLAGLALVSYLAAEDPIKNLGNLTAYSLAITVLSLLFTALTALSVLAAVGSLATEHGWRLRIYSLLVSLACSSTVAYLAYHGLIGIRLWEY